MPDCATMVITVCDPGVGPYKHDVKVGCDTLLLLDARLSGTAEATRGGAVGAGAVPAAVAAFGVAGVGTVVPAGEAFACGASAKDAALVGLAVPLDSQESSTICVAGSRFLSGLLHLFVLQHSTFRTPFALNAAATDRHPALSAAI